MNEFIYNDMRNVSLYQYNNINQIINHKLKANGDQSKNVSDDNPRQELGTPNNNATETSESTEQNGQYKRQTYFR